MLRTSRVPWLLALTLLLGDTCVARAEEASEEGATEEACPAADPLEALDVTIDATFSSQYVWRGLALADDGVFQPSLDVAYEGFTLNVWGNVDLSDAPGSHGRVTEVDLTGSFAHTWGRLTATVGVVSYFALAGDDTSTEAFLSLGLDVPLEPTLSVFRDLGTHDGTYLNLAISHAFEDLLSIGGCLAVSPEVGAGLGYGSRSYDAWAYGADTAGLADLTLSLKVPVSMGEHVQVSAFASYSVLLDGQIREAAPDDDLVWFGASLTASF